ncbi:MAG: regulatory protein RecX [Ruminococcus sp.]|nr:regulatory protein RecX [Ruminococcus sp.]
MTDKIRVTGVTPYKGSTYKIEFEEGEPYFLNKQTVDMFSLRAGAVLPLSAWEQITGEEQFRKAKERALYLLDRRDYSYTELFRKLEQTYPEDICFRVMDKMVELGTVNDRRYAEGLARHYIEVKRFGLYRAKREMKARGLTGEVIDEALSAYEDDWYERLYELVKEKYLRYLEDENGERRVTNALVRGGYSFSQVREVLRDIEDEYE